MHYHVLAVEMASVADTVLNHHSLTTPWSSRFVRWHVLSSPSPMRGIITRTSWTVSMCKQTLGLERGVLNLYLSYLLPVFGTHIEK